MKPLRIVKISGHELSDANFVAQWAQKVALLRQENDVIVVHGGGRAISELHTQLGVPTVIVEGLRVTNTQSFEIVEMVLSGMTNKMLVRALSAENLPAIGFSGVDANLLIAEKKSHPTTDYGFVGTVVACNPAILHTLLSADYLPVISPVSVGRDGHGYNVNADDAASALAGAMEATQLDFISNVPGVLHHGQTIPQLTYPQTEQLIAEGVISGGMIPKVQAAFAAMQGGVRRVRIVNLAGLAAQAGTVFVAEEGEK